MRLLWRSEGGVTLLEVVLSVAILSIAVLSFTNLISSGFAASVQSGRTSQGAVLAQEKMEVLRAHTYGELLQMGAALNNGVFPCPAAAVSSVPAPISGFDGLKLYYSMSCYLMQFDGYPVQALRLEVVVRQEEGRQVARIISFIPKGS